MANDITGINSGRTQQSGDRHVHGSKNSGHSDKGNMSSMGGSGSDKVTLTGTAAKLKEIEGNLAEQPVIDAARVQDVKDSLKAGDFKVNPERVADKMLNFESAFDK